MRTMRFISWRDEKDQARFTLVLEWFNADQKCVEDLRYQMDLAEFKELLKSANQAALGQIR